MSDNFNQDIEIIGKSDDEQKVWGLFSVSKMNGKFLSDSEGEIIAPSEMQRMAHDFNLNFRQAGVNHVKTSNIGRLIESFAFTEETSQMLEKVLKSVGVENPVIKPNAEFWVGAFKIEDKETWDLVKSGDFESFSIGGKARRREIDVNSDE